MILRSLLCSSLIGASLAAADLPPDSAYVRVDDQGHLSLDGKRVKYWGWIGHFWLAGKLKEFAVKAEDSAEVRAAKVAKAREVFDAMAQRIHDLGFNLVRIWHDVAWSKPYAPGDGSAADHLAFSLHALEQRGIKVWVTSFNSLGSARPDQVDVIDDPQTAEAWSKALEGMKDRTYRHAKMRAFDPRLRELSKRAMREVADWPNHYKGGLRFGDDPQNVVWELSNEEWWYAHMANGHWQKWPPFFRDQVTAAWNDWLRQHYGDDDGLTKAWGFLLPGESLVQGNVILISPGGTTKPEMVNDANPAALAALTAVDSAITRDDVTRQRCTDVMRFLDEVHIAYKVDQRDAAKAMGRSLALSPMLLDTGDGFRIQSVNLHQHGDASTMCTYLWQTAIDRQQPRFPWVSGLEEPPRLSMGIPWAEVGRIPGKPFFVYEIQQNNPDKYRAEFPYRVAMIAATQDWDIVNWHIFGRPNDPAEAEPYSKTMNMSHAGNGGSIEGVHFKHDEIYASAMQAAGTIFTQDLLKTVETPTVVIFGSDDLYDPVSADYGKSFGSVGSKIAATAWRYGLHMRIDPTRSETTVEGPLVERGLMEANPVRPTSEMSFDWQRGILTFDAPAVNTFVGFHARHGDAPYRFSSGLALGDVRIVNPEKMPYPVTDDERYLAFSCIARDGLPLAESKDLLISLVSTSFNNGFSLNHDEVAKGNMGHTGKPYVGMNPGYKTPEGEDPVLIARVGATLTAPWLDGLSWTAVDWHFREVASGTIANGTLSIPADLPIFSITCRR